MSLEITPDRTPRFLDARVAGPLTFEIAAGAIMIELPDRRVVVRHGARPGPIAELRILRWQALRRIAFSGGVGLAEAYMEGEIATADLQALLAFGIANEPVLGRLLRGDRLMRWLGWIGHALRANTRRGSRRNIAAHYDLGNAFYRLWLDRSMSYSAALFASPEETLESAQRRKYQRIAERAGITRGMRVLEVGCGWGGFLEFAARELGCHVTGITLSAAQHRFATERMAKAGLADKVDVRLQDYRDCAGRFDAVVSIEMFEAIGERNWPGYFARLADWLAPGGRAALQIITIAEPHFAAYRRAADFIQRYIFPGGMLPPESAVVRHAEAAGFSVPAIDRFGADYARTVRDWREAFLQRWPEIERLGFDARFKRMWEYYLDYCIAGFDHGRIDVAHFTLLRGDAPAR